MGKLKAVVFQAAGSRGVPGKFTVRIWELQPGKKYEEVSESGLFDSSDEAVKAARRLEREYKESLPKKPAAPLRKVVSFKERGNYGDTYLFLECNHTVKRKGGWYITDQYKPGDPPDKEHYAKCEVCLKKGVLE
jgi:hypothetical protein